MCVAQLIPDECSNTGNRVRNVEEHGWSEDEIKRAVAEVFGLSDSKGKKTSFRKSFPRIPYLATYRAETLSNSEIRIVEAPSTNLSKTRVIVLDEGRIAFDGSAAEFGRHPAETIL